MKFNIILADPPWRFKNFSMAERAERGEKWGRAYGRPIYDTINTEDIANIPVKEIADKDCILFLWATYPKLKDALQVMEAWGFEYKTTAFTWVKTNPSGIGWHLGLGFYSRGNPEIVLLGTRGKPKRVNNSVANLLIAPRGRHSAKPKEVHTRIVQLMGDLPRIELFAREQVDGWLCIGNELTNRDIQDDLQIIIDHVER